MSEIELKALKLKRLRGELEEGLPFRCRQTMVFGDETHVVEEVPGVPPGSPVKLLEAAFKLVEYPGREPIWVLDGEIVTRS